MKLRSAAPGGPVPGSGPARRPAAPQAVPVRPAAPPRPVWPIAERANHFPQGARLVRHIDMIGPILRG